MPELTMEQLFEEAEEKGLWFFSPYQGLWFSPDELQSAQALGKFRWSVQNFQLRDPHEGLKLREQEIKDAQEKYDRFKAKLEQAGVETNARS